MATQSQEPKGTPAVKRRRGLVALLVTTVLFAGSTAVLAGLLMNIWQRKQEAKNPYLRFVNVTDETTDPAEWGKNWPREYDGYQRTVNATRTRYGGGSVSEAELPPEKAVLSPWLTRMFAGYAFAIDYRDRRGTGAMGVGIVSGFDNLDNGYAGDKHAGECFAGGCWHTGAVLPVAE